jgi:hypothetical protein
MTTSTPKPGLDSSEVLSQDERDAVNKVCQRMFDERAANGLYREHVDFVRALNAVSAKVVTAMRDGVRPI